MPEAFVMDPILAALPASLLRLVEDQLSNNDVSSDDEPLDHFISDGLTEEQARRARPTTSTSPTST